MDKFKLKKEKNISKKRKCINMYIYIYLYILLSLTSNDSNPQAPYDDWFRAGNWTDLSNQRSPQSW